MPMGHRPGFWVPGLALLLAAGCAGEGASTDVYELSGVVREELSGSAVSGARVTFTSDTLYSRSTTTDGDGLYEMVVETDAPFGQVRAEKAGYRPAEETVYFDSPTRRVDLFLRESPSESE